MLALGSLVPRSTFDHPVKGIVQTAGFGTQASLWAQTLQNSWEATSLSAACRLWEDRVALILLALRSVDILGKILSHWRTQDAPLSASKRHITVVCS